MKIYYDTEEIYEGDPMEAPPLGVQVITQTVRDKKTILHGDDYYWWVKDEGYWEGSDHFGLMEQMIYNLDNIGKVLCGRFMHYRKFAQILQQAIEEQR